MNFRPLLNVSGAALLAFVALPLHADSITVNNLPYPDVRISTVKNGEIFFTTGTGNEVHKPIGQVGKINVTGEAALNAAEEAYQQKDWDKAASGYDKVVRSTGKPWLKDWATVRLLEASNKGGRFDLAVKEFINLVEKSPAQAKAMQATLTMPRADSTYLNDAVTQLEAALKRNPKDEPKGMLLRLLADVQTLKGDTKGADETLTKLAEAKAAADPNSPEALRAAVMLKLKGMRRDIAAKEYDKVFATIEKDGAAFTDPADQAEAMLIAADAQSARAGESKDVNVWKEVAVAYTRVVANAPGTPQAATALLRLAQIHETRLNEKQTAIKLYEEVAQEYKGQDSAQKADAELARLRK